MSVLLVRGSASALPLKGESVQCVVTSPPYWGLRQYAGEQREVWGGDPEHAHEFGEAHAVRRWKPGDGGKQDYQVIAGASEGPRGSGCACGAWYGALGLEPTPEMYVEHMVAVFRAVRRVLRRDGTLWLNLGDSYAAHNSGNNGYDDGRANRAERTAAGVPPGLKPKDLVGIPWMVAFALRADGWYLRSDIIWAKPNPMPESVVDRPTKSHEYLFLLSKSPTYFYDADAIREPLVDDPVTYLKKMGSRAHGSGTMEEVGAGRKAGGFNDYKSRDGYVPAGRNKRTVWNIATQPYAGAHFATFPEALVEPCILAGSAAQACGVCGAPWERVSEKTYEPTDRTPAPNKGHLGAFGERAANMTRDGFIPNRSPNVTQLGWQPTCAHADGSGASVVLDIFNGSGTTGAVAIRHGRNYVGLDISREYLSEQALYRIDPLAGAHQDARRYDGTTDRQTVMAL